MDNLTKDTYVFCPHFNFFGTIEGLQCLVEDLDELENFSVVSVLIANKEPFMTVDDYWLINLISKEVEHQGCDNERSTESGNEMSVVEQLLLKHITVDYKSIMAEMPQLFYGQGEEFEINLKDY